MPKICEFKNCKNRANYGYTNGSLERCKEHKEDRKLASRICKCGISQPSFNFDGESIAVCCTICREPNMIDIKHKKCFCGRSNPNFNYEGEKKGVYCNKCKKDGMINITSKRCKCGKIPNFNYPNEKAGIFCVNCKLDGMIDIKHIKCRCGKRASFNYINEKKPLYCSDCKNDKMLDIVHNKCSCGTIPIFNFEGESKAVCCSKCKLDGMIDIVNKKCKNNCGQVGNFKYKGYCSFCYGHLFPNDPLTFQIRYKTKEIAIRDYINKNFEGFICDRMLETNHCDCTVRRRPDLRKLINETMLCIEIDENQHKSYSEMDEETRYNDLYMAYSGKWIYIRINPDKYKKNNKSFNPTIATRLEKLKQEVEKQIERIDNNENDELIERIYLYYDFI